MTEHSLTIRNGFWRPYSSAMLMSLPAFGQGMTKGIMSPPANVRPPGLKNVGIEQHLDEQIPPTSLSAMKPGSRSAWEITSARSR